MYLQVKASSLDLQMPTRGRVAPRLGRAPQLGRQITVYHCPTCITSCAHFLLSLLHFKARVLIAPQTHSNVNV